MVTEVYNIFSEFTLEEYASIVYQIMLDYHGKIDYIKLLPDKIEYSVCEFREDLILW